MTNQVFTSLQGIDRRTDICRVSPMAYQERVGPLSFLQARAAYGDKPLKMLKPRSFIQMTVREFYESRYCVPGTRG
eukprot:6176896-Prorocentrum_lima.AAC.1